MTLLRLISINIKNPRPAIGGGRLINFIVFICGAIVMSFEILGSRVLAPNFGSSVFVWGSLISVFLDRALCRLFPWRKACRFNPSSRKLGLMIIAPGLLFLVSRSTARPISDWIFMKDLGVRTQPLARLCRPLSDSLCVSWHCKSLYRKADDLQPPTSGKTIGTLYALSTFGSIIGTLITSFYLITVAGVNALIMGQGVLLVLSAIPLFFMKLRCNP